MSANQQLQQHILETLAQYPSYGYRIAQCILRRAPQLLESKESALYPVLYQLELEGALESWKETAHNQTRRYYRITHKGRGKLVKVDKDLIPAKLSPQLTLGVQAI